MPISDQEALFSKSRTQAPHTEQLPQVQEATVYRYFTSISKAWTLLHGERRCLIWLSLMLTAVTVKRSKHTANILRLYCFFTELFPRPEQDVLISFTKFEMSALFLVTEVPWQEKIYNDFMPVKYKVSVRARKGWQHSHFLVILVF